MPDILISGYFETVMRGISAIEGGLEAYLLDVPEWKNIVKVADIFVRNAYCLKKGMQRVSCIASWCKHQAPRPLSLK
jgi:hypothetical protein